MSTPGDPNNNDKDPNKPLVAVPLPSPSSIEMNARVLSQSQTNSQPHSPTAVPRTAASDIPTQSVPPSSIYPHGHSNTNTHTHTHTNTNTNTNSQHHDHSHARRPSPLTRPSLPLSSSYQSNLDNAGHHGRGADVEESRIAMLLTAASKDNVDRVLSLLQSGVDVNGMDYDRRTALHVACSDGALDVVKVLLEEGADVNVKDRFGHTPLDEAVIYGHEQIADLLKYYAAQHGSIEKLEAQLLLAATQNDLPAAQKLLKSGVNPNCRTYAGRTPLQLAVSDGLCDMAKLLLEYKANPYAEDRWGLSPLTELQRRLTRTGQDPMRDVFAHLLDNPHAPPLLSKFVLFYIGWEIIFIVLMGLFGRYDSDSDGGSDINNVSNQLNFASVYPLYQDVHVMIFIGFGYLMVFLRKHGYTSVGVTFLVAAFVIQWYQLCRGFWQSSFQGVYNQVFISIPSIVAGDFCAGSVLITFGVVLGKVSPSQMLVVALIETVTYSLNERIGLLMEVADVGGTMTIHLFGAMFGFAVSKLVTQKSASGNQNNASVYHSDIMAMIGTIFLWLFWPSFNAALAVGNAQARAVINTLLSISASCVTAFLSSYMFRRDARFNMVDIQNATLAGGVAMGACCDMLILPGPAMAIGAIAGIVSVIGFVYIQPYLEQHIGLHDTCGVNNLHCMPALVGGFASVIASGMAHDTSYDTGEYTVIWGIDRATSRSAATQAGIQAAYIFITIGIALASGLCAGSIAKISFFDPPLPDKVEDVFQDDKWWQVPRLELPYYFDHRGEISRGAGNIPDFMNNKLPPLAVGTAVIPVVDPASSPTAAATATTAAAVKDDLQMKAKYQRALESKLEGLEQQIQMLKKQQRSTNTHHLNSPNYVPVVPQQPLYQSYSDGTYVSPQHQHSYQQPQQHSTERRQPNSHTHTQSYAQQRRAVSPIYDSPGSPLTPLASTTYPSYPPPQQQPSSYYPPPHYPPYPYAYDPHSHHPPHPHPQAQSSAPPQTTSRMEVLLSRLLNRLDDKDL